MIWSLKSGPDVGSVRKMVQEEQIENLKSCFLSLFVLHLPLLVPQKPESLPFDEIEKLAASKQLQD